MRRLAVLAAVLAAAVATLLVVGADRGSLRGDPVSGTAGAASDAGAARARTDSAADPVAAAVERAAVGGGPGPGIRVLSRAAFFARLAELGIHVSPDVFERIHGQRADLGALFVLAIDSESRPMSGARAFVDPAARDGVSHHLDSGKYSPKVRSAITRVSGIAVFSNLAPEAYLLAVEHRSYVTRYLGAIDVAAGVETFVEAVLEGPDATIEGFVENPRGVRLEGVLLVAGRHTEGGVPFESSAVSGYDGTFRVGVRDGTQYALAASKLGYESVLLVGIAAGTRELEVVLEPADTVTVRGHVTRGTTSEPVTAFRVDADSIVDAGGVFEVERNAEPQSLVFAAEGYRTRVVPVDLSSGEDVDLGRIALFENRELNGIVLLRREDGGTAPVADAAVSIHTGHGEDASMRTPAEGVFSFRDIGAEQVELSVVAARAKPDRRTVPLQAREPTFVEVVLEPGEYEVSGTIVDVDSEEPLGGVRVEVVGRSDLAAETGGDGRYSIPGIAAPEFGLRASKSGYRDELSPLLVGDPEGVVWNGRMTPSGLRMRFRIGATPAPPGVSVVLWKAIEPTLAAALAAQASLGTLRLEAVTEADGTVTFDVEDGAYFVQVPAYRLHPKRVVADDTVDEWLELELPGRTLLRGRIAYADGSPAASTSLWLHSGDQDYSTMFLYHTDAAGRYEIPNLAARLYALSIIKSTAVQSAQHVVELAVTGAPVQALDVRFPPLTASVSGRVTDEQGNGKRGVHVGVEFLDASHRSILAGWERTSPTGEFHVPLLEPGRHRVRTAWTEDEAAYSDVVVLSPGQHVRVDLVAPRVRGKHVRGHMIAADGGPLGGNFVFSTDADGRQNGNFFSTMDWAYVGEFDVRGLRPGSHRIDLTAMGCRKAHVQVGVADDVSGLLVVMEREGP